VGPAVFWDVAKLQAGDVVEIHMDDGSVARYQVEFNKHIPSDEADWNAIVAGTADESITLITCTGEFSAGHYSDRQIVWGRRIS
jgi:LPXTG-site transpeptidase (sortase) family protein